MAMDGSLALRSSRCPTIAPSRGRIPPSRQAFAREIIPCDKDPLNSFSDSPLFFWATNMF